MKKSFIAALKARIVARNPEIKTFELFNNQLDSANERKENPIVFPAVFVEFESIDWKQQGRGIQIGNARIKLHIADETYKTNISSSRIDKPNDVDFMDTIAGLHVSLNGFDDEFFTPLSRVSETQDTNHDQIRVWQTTYSTQITDDGAETRFAKQLANLVPDQIGAIGLVINTPDAQTNEIIPVGAWWWFVGSNPSNVRFYFRFDIGTVDPDTMISLQINSGNGWETIGGALRSSFVDGDGSTNQNIEFTSTLTQIDPPAVNARIMLTGIGHSPAILVLPD